MKKILACTKTIIILLAATIISSVFYGYMLARPVSFGMGYHNVTVYEGGTFEGTMKFYSDGTMVNRNTNFDEEIKSRYYYKDGYLFFTMAETYDEYEIEVASINENFDEAISMPFYADKINAFRLVAEEVDGYATVYTCTPAIIFAVAYGVIELMLISMISISLNLRKNRNVKNE